MEKCKVEECDGTVVRYRDYCPKHFLEKYTNSIGTLTIVLLDRIVTLLEKKLDRIVTLLEKKK